MVKKKFDEEALARRASARSFNRREATKIRESYNKEVLDLIYSNDQIVEKTFLSAKSKHDPRAIRATAYVLADRARKVLTSLGINPPLKLDVNYYRNETRSVNAATDFKGINISFDMGMVDPSDMDKIGSLLAALKGVVYHEGGHILCTLPWSALFDCALMDNGLLPVAINPHDTRWGDEFANLYPAYEDVRSSLVTVFDRVPFGERVVNPATNITNKWYAHQQQYRPFADAIQISWNLLEDGRMEEEMVINSPPLIDYFTALVLNYINDDTKPGYSWPFVTTRSYLDQELMDNARQLAYKFALDNDMDISLVDQIENQVHVYRESRSATDVVIAVWQLHNLITQWITGANNGQEPRPDDSRGREGKGTPNPTGGDHKNGHNGATQVTKKPTFGNEEKGWETKPGESKKESSEEGEESPGGGKEGEGKANGEAPTKDGNETATEFINNTGGTKGTGGQIKENVDYAKIREDLKQKAAEAMKRVVTDEEIGQLISEINSELMRDLPHNGAVSEMPSNLLVDSIAVANQMLSALEPLALTADPAWRFRQEHGVLDPTSYKMHEPGDSDYWVDYEGEGAHGHSLAVSVMLDTSGSMGGWMDQLSVAAYGIRSACDSLGVPCTVSTFDTEPYMIWDNDEPITPVLIHDGGGTNPLEGLRQIKNQNAGKQRHLVVILTDGEWSYVNSIKPFVEPGQYWLLVGLGTPGYAKDLVAKKGGDVAIGIDNVMDLPKEIEKALIGFLA